MIQTFFFLLNVLSCCCASFTPPPMSTPVMTSAPERWDTRDIKFFFGLRNNRMFRNSTTSSGVYFYDPNRQINKENSTMIVKSLNEAMQNQLTISNRTTTCLSVGVAVIAQVNVISENGTYPYMINFSRIIRQMWGTMGSECNGSILLFVSCKDFFIHETLGPNTLNTLDPRCRYVFDIAEPLYKKNIDDCFSGLIESRIAMYKTIMDGSHH